MRDYAELVKALRYCSTNDSDAPCNKQCPYYDKRDGYECIWEMMRKTADAIEELLAKDTNVPDKWISVEERLPDEDMEVLISYRYKEGEGDTSHVNIDITTFGQMYFGGREVEGVKHWRPPFEYFSSNYEVVAWMPLPEPPKEETND